jgi:hypothetical protein
MLNAIDVPAAAPRARMALARLRDHLGGRRGPSGLYYHDGRSRLRRRFPNIATEIYTLLALVHVAQRLGDAPATMHARVLGDRLLSTQLPDGAWPWLFDAETGSVIEPYEVYSVHQDAMAPMALLELSALTGAAEYAEAARAGLGWSTGNNELGVNLLDDDALFAHRSIRRAPPWHRVALATSVAAALTGTRARPRRWSPLELNRTCRPYHLGWILEAWAGR